MGRGLCSRTAQVVTRKAFICKRIERGTYIRAVPTYWGRVVRTLIARSVRASAHPLRCSQFLFVDLAPPRAPPPLLVFVVRYEL